MPYKREYDSVARSKYTPVCASIHLTLSATGVVDDFKLFLFVFKR